VRDLHTYVFISTIQIAKIWTQLRCPSTDEWIKKVWCIYTMEHYSAIKKNEIMTFVGKWMELEIIMLSEINQTENDTYHRFLLI
jgi:hypothetical protein